MDHTQYTTDFDSDRSFHTVLASLIDRPVDDLLVDTEAVTGLGAAWISTPLGPMIAVTDEHALHLLEFFDRKGLATALKKLQIKKGAVGIGRHPLTDLIEEELHLYFKGQLTEFKTPIAQLGSDFTRDVWRALTNIPVGETRSYQSLAQELGRPTAVRAVARANGANNIAIAVPCHRLVASNGALTGYGGGLWRKQWLIDHENGLPVGQTILSS